MEDVKEVGEALRRLGYRLTPQRLMILAAVKEADGHLSAEEIHAQVRAQYPHINLSTVYRTLELLKNQGLVTETDLGEGRLRYHPAAKAHHHHLICQQCGTVFEMDDSLLIPLKQGLLREHDFEANLSHLAIYGRCAQCRSPLPGSARKAINPETSSG